MSAAHAVAPAAAIGAAASRRQGSPLRARAVAKQGKISGKFSRHGITKTTGVKSVRKVPLGARDLAIPPRPAIAFARTNRVTVFIGFAGESKHATLIH